MKINKFEGRFGQGYTRHVLYISRSMEKDILHEAFAFTVGVRAYIIYKINFDKGFLLGVVSNS